MERSYVLGRERENCFGEAIEPKGRLTDVGQPTLLTRMMKEAKQ